MKDKKEGIEKSIKTDRERDRENGESKIFYNNNGNR
jgi:hypothetical protein